MVGIILRGMPPARVNALRTITPGGRFDNGARSCLRVLGATERPLLAQSGDVRQGKNGRQVSKGSWSLAHIIIVREDVTRRPYFRKYVNNPLRILECGKHRPLEEIDGNIYAAERNAVIERCRRCQPL